MDSDLICPFFIVVASIEGIVHNSNDDSIQHCLAFCILQRFAYEFNGKQTNPPTVAEIF